MSTSTQHASLRTEWTATIDDAVARLARETAAECEQAGVEAGELAKDFPGRPELAPGLREELVNELVDAAVALWATGIPRLVIKALPGLIVWWLQQRSYRSKRSLDDESAAARLLEIDRRLFATVRRASDARASRRTVRALSEVRKEYADLLQAGPPSYLAGPGGRSLADATEQLARAHASRGDADAAAREYRSAEEAWARVGDGEAARRCRESREA